MPSSPGVPDSSEPPMLTLRITTPLTLRSTVDDADRFLIHSPVPHKPIEPVRTLPVQRQVERPPVGIDLACKHVHSVLIGGVEVFGVRAKVNELLVTTSSAEVKIVVSEPLLLVRISGMRVDLSDMGIEIQGFDPEPSDQARKCDCIEYLFDEDDNFDSVEWGLFLNHVNELVSGYVILVRDKSKVNAATIHKIDQALGGSPSSWAFLEVPNNE